jgi:hypothetical protein
VAAEARAAEELAAAGERQRVMELVAARGRPGGDGEEGDVGSGANDER